MKPVVDILIINNVPSFYKINLYNELAKKCKIHVVFIALTNQVVINDFFQKDIHFSYELLSNIQIENRNKWKSLRRLYNICKHYNYKKIIYGGYIDFEEIILMFLTPKYKNCLQFESSIKESKVSGSIALIKKVILSRVSIALPSGKLQTDVFKALEFKGKIIETKGVGFFDKKKPRNINCNIVINSPKYIYVGRLISLKNLDFLIRIFNELNKPLTIVGSGVLEAVLKKQANSNISFTGFVPNNEINKLYTSNDIFILPSISEPWGLVVEEAIYYGLPVLVSDAVGCQEEMVVKPNTGIVFSNSDEISLKKAIDLIEANLNIFKKNCQEFNFEKRDLDQVHSYLKILEI